jgi:DNA-binding MarR family transcriptional regulator
MAIENLYSKPGYQMRRLRQIAAAVFAAEAATFDVTAQQWTTLQAIGELSGLEQNELSAVVSLDRATLATLLARLEEKGLVRRTTSTIDRRRKHIAITPRGRRVLEAMAPVVDTVQDRIMAPLSPAERLEFSRMLTLLVDAHGASIPADAKRQEEAS